MANIIKSPSSLRDGFSVFLGGSIESGKAEDWQALVEEKLSATDAILFNPRRDDWDPTWMQDADDRNFRRQVEWELEALEKADIIAMYFDPQTKSPVSLLELGLFARTGKMIVCCPDGFWRKGNVDIVCAKYGVKQVETLSALVSEILRLANGQQGMTSC